MGKYLLFAAALLIGLGNNSCSNREANNVGQASDHLHLPEKKMEVTVSNVGKSNELSGFVPKDYVIADTTYGDLNKDGLKDCVVMIKGTNKNRIVPDEFSGALLDRNRRGLIILLSRNGAYHLALKNDDCFSSENEYGGVYTAPELLLETGKGNLYIHYAHGRYGYWRYTFRLINAAFQLIGYDASDNSGPVIDKEISIEYLNNRKIVRVNTNKNAESGGEVFKETRTSLNRGNLIKLSEIKDFDELKVSNE